MTPEQLAEIEARAKAATEGPWHRHLPENSGVCNWSAGIEWEVITGGTVQDHEFIAHARQDIPDLIAAYREQEKRIAELEGVVSGLAYNAAEQKDKRHEHG